MNKILLISSREYLTRVRKKSFVIMTFLTPLLIGCLYLGSILIAMSAGDERVIEVLDESHLFKNKLPEINNIKFVFIEGSLEKAKESFLEKETDGLLYIPALNVNSPEGIKFFSESNTSIDVKSSIEKSIASEIENIRLLQSGIDKKVLDGIKTNISISTISITEEGETNSNAGASTAAGVAVGMLMYFFIFIYGSQVMRGVLEEKTNRIVEVVISSVKPFQLMMGKIFGIAAVGLTQFLLWIILSTAVSGAVAAYLGSRNIDMNDQAIEMAAHADRQQQASQATEFFAAASSINLPSLLTVFFFYFIGGYLLYASLFAAIGAAADNETDTQQFMFPVTIPLVFSVIMLSVVLRDPDGNLAFWLSLIPFTSPIIMLIRWPFGVPGWQLALSMVFLVAGFISTSWMAARIYRIGIFMYGKKVNYKELAKWIFMKM